MNKLSLIILVLLVSARVSHAAPFDISSIRVSPHKVDDYIRAAVSLQELGREAACQAMLASAKTKTNAMLDARFFVLCRMLFTQRGTNEFRPPLPKLMWSAPTYIGEASDWPLAPIELVDGIPFFLGGGGGGGGGTVPEFAESYLHYCMTNCDWNTYRFREVTTQQKRDALTKLLASDKLRRPVPDFVRRRFEAQIE